MVLVSFAVAAFLSVAVNVIVLFEVDGSSEVLL